MKRFFENFKDEGNSEKQREIGVATWDLKNDKNLNLIKKFSKFIKKSIFYSNFSPLTTSHELFPLEM